MKTLCVDFDGVLHSYASGWQGPHIVADEPVPGAMAWLTEMVALGYDVQIYSARSSQPGGREAMKSWLIKHLPVGAILPDEYELTNPELYIETYIKFPVEKPSAWLTIDDRAICFRGTFPSSLEIENFKPWNK